MRSRQALPPPSETRGPVCARVPLPPYAQPREPLTGFHRTGEGSTGNTAGVAFGAPHLPDAPGPRRRTLASRDRPALARSRACAPCGRGSGGARGGHGDAAGRGWPGPAAHVPAAPAPPPAPSAAAMLLRRPLPPRPARQLGAGAGAGAGGPERGRGERGGSGRWPCSSAGRKQQTTVTWPPPRRRRGARREDGGRKARRGGERGGRVGPAEAAAPPSLLREAEAECGTRTGWRPPRSAPQTQTFEAGAGAAAGRTLAPCSVVSALQQVPRRALRQADLPSTVGASRPRAPRWGPSLVSVFEQGGGEPGRE